MFIITSLRLLLHCRHRTHQNVDDHLLLPGDDQLDFLDLAFCPFLAEPVMFLDFAGKLESAETARRYQGLEPGELAALLLLQRLDLVQCLRLGVS